VNTASAPEATGAESLRARETLKALYGYVRPHRWAVALGLLSALAGAAGGLFQPLATKALVDRFSSGGTIGTILLAMTVLVLLISLLGARVRPRHLRQLLHRPGHPRTGPRIRSGALLSGLAA
jgi:hypothetical protein